MVTVLSILRQAIGLQQSPPNMLIVSLALFLTYFVMAPVFEEAYAVGIGPLIDGTLPPQQALSAAYGPFRGFMLNRVEAETLQSLAELRGLTDIADPDPSILIPAFMLSEVERAFQIGFLIFLPFLIIDLVVAAILMSMGMMMVPPVIVSPALQAGLLRRRRRMGAGDRRIGAQLFLTLSPRGIPMTDSPRIQPPQGTTRAEKLQAIAAVFGEEVAARLGQVPDPAARPGADDPDRLAWQTNRLIRHLRDRVAMPGAAPPATDPPPGDRPAPAPFRRSRANAAARRGRGPRAGAPAPSSLIC